MDLSALDQCDAAAIEQRDSAVDDGPDWDGPRSPEQALAYMLARIEHFRRKAHESDDRFYDAEVARVKADFLRWTADCAMTGPLQ